GGTGPAAGEVAARAACDARLSAGGLGAVGSNFGTAEPAWAGASGPALLRATAALLAGAGFAVGNVAIQVIGTRPRIAARRGEAQKVLAEALGGAPGSVSGATTHGLRLTRGGGARTGGGEAMAALATAVVTRSCPRTARRAQPSGGASGF